VRRALIIVVVLGVVAALTAVAVVAFTGDDSEAKREPIRIASSSGSSAIYGQADASSPQPIARLPGITVIGSGEVEVKPDTALVRLTVGSGSGGAFSGTGAPSAELVDEDALDPIVDALVDAGAPRDEIYVDPFGGSGFGPDETAAVITVEWPKPKDVRELLAAAQHALDKEKSGLSLENVAVAFMREDCDDADADAANAALADARKRAERIAALSQAKVGKLIAVSEATSASYLSAVTQQQCGVNGIAPGLLGYAGGTSTADKMTLNKTLEVTFALER
jgi:uncharacterized protein YggE